MKFYVSFGLRYAREPHPLFWKVPDLPDRLWEVEAPDEERMREMCRELIDNRYAFLYTENTVDFWWFPAGTFTYDIDTGKIELGEDRAEAVVDAMIEQLPGLADAIEKEQGSAPEVST